jgi:hypothetical protein
MNNEKSGNFQRIRNQTYWNEQCKLEQHTAMFSNIVTNWISTWNSVPRQFIKQVGEENTYIFTQSII